MMRIAGYLKFAGLLLFIAYVIGIIAMLMNIANSPTAEFIFLFFQFIFYVLIGPSVPITMFAVSSLIEMREDDVKEYVTKHQLAIKQKRVFAEGEWTCVCGHENKSNYKVCINCGKPRG